MVVTRIGDYSFAVKGNELIINGETVNIKLKGDSSENIAVNIVSSVYKEKKCFIRLKIVSNYITLIGEKGKINYIRVNGQEASLNKEGFGSDEDVNKGAKKYLISTAKEDKIKVDGEICCRIIAIEDIVDEEGVILVKKGEKGGYISDRSRLSEYGTCWVYDGAIVRETANIKDDARILDSSDICGCAEIGGNVVVCGKAKVYGNVSLAGNVKVTGRVNFGGSLYLSGDEVITSNKQIRDLTASNVERGSETKDNSAINNRKLTDVRHQSKKNMIKEQVKKKIGDLEIGDKYKLIKLRCLQTKLKYFEKVAADEDLLNISAKKRIISLRKQIEKVEKTAGDELFATSFIKEYKGTHLDDEEALIVLCNILVSEADMEMSFRRKLLQLGIVEVFKCMGAHIQPKQAEKIEKIIEMHDPVIVGKAMQNLVRNPTDNMKGLIRNVVRNPTCSFADIEERKSIDFFIMVMGGITVALGITGVVKGIPKSEETTKLGMAGIMLGLALMTKNITKYRYLYEREELTLGCIDDLCNEVQREEKTVNHGLKR